MLPGNNHAGYYPGTTTRRLVWYDETGNANWLAAQGTFAQNYLNYWSFWNGNGVKLGYLDYRTSGGTAGCGNQYRGLDVCGGNPGAGYEARATIYKDSSQHVTYATVTVRLASGITAAQKSSVICQEVSHVLGLDHNPSTGSCMYQQVIAAAPQFYDLHDDETMRGFYGGHLP